MTLQVTPGSEEMESCHVGGWTGAWRWTESATLGMLIDFSEEEVREYSIVDSAALGRAFLAIRTY